MKPSKSEIKLQSAKELFISPPTNIVEQAEAAKILRDDLKLSRAQIAEVLGITIRQVRTRLVSWKTYVLRGDIPTGKLPSLSSEEPLQEVLKDEEARLEILETRYVSKDILKQDTFLTKMTQAIAPYLPTSHDLSYIETIYKKSQKEESSHKDLEVAVATMSDLHLCLNTKSHTFETGAKANDRFMSKVFKLTDLQRTHKNIKTLHINALGDLIQGTANFSNQRWSVDRPSINQAEALTEILVRDIELSLVNFENVVVNFREGNHGYIVSAKTSPDPDFSNWETVVGRSLQWAFRNHPRVKINLSEDWYSIVDILGTKMLLTHGHAVSGSGSFDNLIKTVNKWHAILPHFDICVQGHWHRLARLPLPRSHYSERPRVLYVNGTSVKEDDFLQRMGGSPTPQWWLFFVGERGVTNEYAVDLYE